MLFPDRTEATEGPPISHASNPAIQGRGRKNHESGAYILDGLRVPVILNPALLDLIDNSPSTGGFTLQSKIDILLLSAIRSTKSQL
jgi:hypothetical protein